MPLGSAVASVFVEIGSQFDGSGFDQADNKLSEADQRLMSMGKGMERAGASMTRSLTLPLVAAGAAALKFAVDFDTSMSRIQGLVGLSADEVGAMREQVLQLAGETTRAPQELSEALFLITSAGLRGSTAMDALEASAKAAAAGLGDTASVADAITSAMNAYGHDVLSAAQATDVLVATVREGKVAAEDLAPQIGRVADIASTLGITFAEVGGLMAFFTSTTGSAELAGTRLDAIMRKVVRPTQQFEEALASVGITTEQFQQMVREQGLTGALQALEVAFDGDTQAVAALFEEGQAVAGVLGILNDKTGSLQGILDSTANSTGALDNAFGAFAESAGFETSQAFAEIQVALIAVGDALAPIAAAVLGFVGDFAGGFASLPGPVLAVITALASLLAAAGPVLWVAGKLQIAWLRLGQVFPVVQSAIVAFSRAIGSMITSLAAAHPAIAAIVAGLTLLGTLLASGTGITSTNWFGEQLDTMSDQLMDAARAAGSAEAGLAAMLGQNIDPGFAASIHEIGLGIEDIVAAVSGDQAGFDAFISQLQDADIPTAELLMLREIFPDIADGMAALEAVGAVGAIEEIVDPAEEAAAAIDELTDAIDRYLGNQFDVEEAKDGLLASFDALGDSLAENGRAWQGSSAAAQANRAAMRDIVTQHADVIRAMAENDAGQQAMQRVTEATIAKLRGARDMGLLSASAFRRLRDDVLGVPRNVGITTRINGADAVVAALQRIYDAAIRAASAVGQTGGSLAGGGSYSGGGGGSSSSTPSGGLRSRVPESSYGRGQAAAWSAMTATGSLGRVDTGGGSAESFRSQRPLKVEVVLDGEVVGRTAALYLDPYLGR